MVGVWTITEGVLFYLNSDVDAMVTTMRNQSESNVNILVDFLKIRETRPPTETWDTKPVIDEELTSTTTIPIPNARKTAPVIVLSKKTMTEAKKSKVPKLETIPEEDENDQSSSPGISWSE